MKLQLKFGKWLCGLGLSAVLLTCGASAQNRAQERPPARQQAPPREANRPPQSNPPTGTYHPQGPRPQAPRSNENRQPTYQDRGSRTNSNPNNNRPPQVNAPRPYDNRGNNQNRGNGRPQSSYRQQTPATAPPNVQERLQKMSPQEKNRLIENQRKFNQLPAQKRQEMKQAAANWQRLTPGQRDHLKNDVIPRWQELPTDRQRAIQQRLGVLQNMPESARNRHLNDPNFTRGMSEEDRQMLQDLSHEHVGAPDRPQP